MRRKQEKKKEESEEYFPHKNKNEKICERVNFTLVGGSAASRKARTFFCRRRYCYRSTIRNNPVVLLREFKLASFLFVLVGQSPWIALVVL